LVWILSLPSSKTECCVIYPHLDFQKKNWVWGLGFYLEGWGKHHNKPNRSISYHISVCSNTFHTKIPNLEKLGTLEVVVVGIYSRSSKSFILMVANGLGPYLYLLSLPSPYPFLVKPSSLVKISIFSWFKPWPFGKTFSFFKLNLYFLTKLLYFPS